MTYKDALWIFENKDKDDIDISKKNLDLATEKAIEALEKQVPMKPVLKGLSYGDLNGGFAEYCSKCDIMIESMDWEKYCPNCGQAIDWSVENE